MSSILVVQRRLGPVAAPLRMANAFFAHAAPDQRMFWSDPGADLAIAAAGVVAVLEPADGSTGVERFDDVAAQRRELAAITIVEPDGSPQPVRLVGGFAFDADHDRDLGAASVNSSPWTGFGSGRLVLPARSVVESGGDVWASAIGWFDDDGSTGTGRCRDEVRTALVADLDQIEAQLQGVDTVSPSPTPPAQSLPAEWHDDDAYVELVRAGVADIAAGRMDKVVLAREASRSVSVDVAALVRDLCVRHPACATFAFGFGDRTFLGSTPERLVSLADDELSTAAVAGTAPRGGDAVADGRLADDLLGSAKERSEHDFVVRAVHERLAELGVVCQQPGDPVVMKLASLQHLHTPIRGHVAAGSDVDAIALAGALHPTPAVAGTPTAVASAWIRDHEAFDRGWYAAPVGWCDLDGEGVFNVGLRSALITPDEARLFAGAGIVADSDPQRELAETTVKLGAVGAVLDPGARPASPMSSSVPAA